MKPLINQSFTLADHERWMDKKIVHRSACPECFNYTTVGKSTAEFKCSNCGVTLGRVDDKTLEPMIGIEE